MKNGNSELWCHATNFQDKGVSGHFYNLSFGTSKYAHTFRGKKGETLIFTQELRGDATIRDEFGPVVKILDVDIDGLVNCAVCDGTSLWLGTSTGIVYIFDAYSFKFLKKIKKSSGITCFTYCLNSIFSAGYGCSILKWSCNDFTPIAKLTGHSNTVRSLTSEFHFLYSCGDDKTVRCWNASNKNSSLVWTAKTDAGVLKLIVEKSLLICQRQDGGICMISKQNGSIIRILGFPEKQRILFKDPESSSIWSLERGIKISIWNDSFEFLRGTIALNEAMRPISALPLLQSKSLTLFLLLKEANESVSLDILSHRTAAEGSDIDNASRIECIKTTYFNCVKAHGALKDATCALSEQEKTLEHLKATLSQLPAEDTSCERFTEAEEGNQQIPNIRRLRNCRPRELQIVRHEKQDFAKLEPNFGKRFGFISNNKLMHHYFHELLRVLSSRLNKGSS